MSEERTLANIAQTAYWTVSENQDTFDRVAKAVEKAVLARLKKDEEEPMPVAGQELTFVQVAQWVENHGSTKGLQWRNDYGKWCNDNVTVVYASVKYRVAPKKVNDPDDPTTWEKGVAILRRNSNMNYWVLDTLKGYLEHMPYKYRTKYEAYRHAKLATPEQIEAWKLINGDL